MKKEFILKVAFSNTLSSSFQRGYVYREKLTDEKQSEYDKKKNELRSSLRDELFSLETIYQKVVHPDEHLKLIGDISKKLTKKHSNILSNKKFRIGTTQKAVNLFLKFLWAYDYTPNEPPHIPLDGIVLKAINSDVKWTELDCIDEYKFLISCVDNVAKESGCSICKWELNLWNKVA